jgi:hypothetical protein
MKGIKGLLMKGLLILIMLFLVFLGNEAMGNEYDKNEYDKYQRIYEIISSFYTAGLGFVPAFVKHEDCVFVLVARKEIPLNQIYEPYIFEYLIVEDDDVRGVCVLIKK